jgi:hypothetical protein
MQGIRRVFGPVLVLTFAACAAPQAPPKAETKSEKAPDGEPAVALQVVKWPELEKAIAAHKGKVVVLDVWGEF